MLWIFIFQFQINLNAFDEALEIAEQFELNVDPIYQKQWLSVEVSKESIAKYLVFLEFVFYLVIVFKRNVVMVII